MSTLFVNYSEGQRHQNTYHYDLQQIQPAHNVLGTTFTTADFKAEYQKQRNTLPDNRSITRYLNSLVEDKLIERVKKGAFRKL